MLFSASWVSLLPAKTTVKCKVKALPTVHLRLLLVSVHFLFVFSTHFSPLFIDRVEICLLTAVASIVFSIVLIILPVLSLDQSYSTSPSRTWRWVLIAIGFCGLILAITECLIAGLSIRIYDNRQRQEKRDEVHFLAESSKLRRFIQQLD